MFKNLQDSGLLYILKARFSKTVRSLFMQSDTNCSQ